MNEKVTHEKDLCINYLIFSHIIKKIDRDK